MHHWNTLDSDGTFEPCGVCNPDLQLLPGAAVLPLLCQLDLLGGRAAILGGMPDAIVGAPPILGIRSYSARVTDEEGDRLLRIVRRGSVSVVTWRRAQIFLRVRHMLGAYDVTRDRLYGHVRMRKTRTEFLAFCRYIRSLHPAETRLHLILDC